MPAGSAKASIHWAVEESELKRRDGGSACRPALDSWLKKRLPIETLMVGVMKKIVLDDILGFGAYEKVREEFRKDIIEKKKRRRLAVGDKVSLVFENRDTVVFQIQEMLRAERITDLDKIREEIAVYNELIPNAGELSATLFLEIEDQDHLRAELLKFLGIDECLALSVGGRLLSARFESGRSKEDKISAVQYVRFAFDEQARVAFMAGERAELIIDHPNYQARVFLSPEAQQSLAEDLAR